MNIIVFGATGQTGSIITREALKKGYKVIAFSRNPKKYYFEDTNLNLFQGNVLNGDDVINSMKNTDAVISVIGVPSKIKENVVSEGHKNIINAMYKLGIKRIIVQSAFGASETNAELTLLLKLIMYKTLGREAFLEKNRMEDIIMESGLDWTIIRPTRLTNHKNKRSYKIGNHLNLGLSPYISREDVADFIINELSEAKYIHEAITLSY